MKTINLSVDIIGDSSLINGKSLFRAENVPKFPPLVAKAMLYFAVQSISNGSKIDIYDPCCGNGTVLSIAATYFKNKIANLYGSDIDKESVVAAELNLDLIDEKSESQTFNSIQPYNIFEANALGVFLPKTSNDLVVVSDPPFGRVCDWKCLDEGSHGLDQFVTNMFSQNQERIVLCYDNSFEGKHILQKHYVIMNSANLKNRTIYSLRAKD